MKRLQHIGDRAVLTSDQLRVMRSCPAGHDLSDLDIIASHIVELLDVLDGPLPLNIVGSDETHHLGLTHDQQRADAQPRHVDQCRANLPILVHRHRILALKSFMTVTARSCNCTRFTGTAERAVALPSTSFDRG